MNRYYDIAPPYLNPEQFTTEEEQSVVTLLVSSRHFASVDLVPVFPRSRDALRKAVLKIARYLQREFGYDFPPFQYHDADPGQAAYLVTNYDDLAVGGLVVCPMDWKGIGEVMTLAWVWLHPYYRRQGILTALWPRLIEKHGPLMVQPPCSPAMKSFLESVGWRLEDWLPRGENPKHEPTP